MKRQGGSRCTIIKLGGSLAKSGQAKHWIKAIAEISKPVILVPGGGPFADTVRQAQREMGFSDRAAHRMALLAMAQYGLAFCDLNARFTPAELPDDFAEAWLSRRIPVWVPDRMIHDCSGIPQSWDVTSDSLAAWLAAEVGAALVVLIKSAIPRCMEISVDEASASGVVDPLFPAFLGKAGVDAIWLGPEDWNRLDLVISGRQGVGARIFCDPAAA